MWLPNRIPVPLRPAATGDSPAISKLVPRESNSSSTTIFVGVGSVLSVLILVFSIYCFSRYKKRSKSERGAYQQASDGESLDASGSRRRAHDGRSDPETNENTATSQIDRNTSIRSVMTLPPYRTKAIETEQVIGREGERDGIDIVIECPTTEDLESMRDEEMEALFQIREARRRENAARDERRRLTREARERGDTAALGELSAQRRAALNSTVVEELRDAYGQVKERRQRAVSSVSYHDLGVAQLNGTRVRANSHEGERVGLLSDAASIAASTRSPSALSHRRDRSASSVLSLDTDIPSPGLRSATSTPRLGSSSHTRAGSSPEIIGEEDLGDSMMPPPDYEDVSLDDVRSGATTPLFNEPPPHYTHQSHSPERRPSAWAGGDSRDVSPTDNSGDGGSASSSRGVGGAPQLPSLRIGKLPQIVIEPSTAHPNDTDRP
ncbi:hypothetical protein GGS23DRAFT_600862 [Durotheca rogersii]|uniref:uncharacterized protein n=1 Tax=Durotheca rogersii TaxID=419775 RepID=UPI00221EEA8C|nr:uncharacterized protein GGS23DRAFT_600862 [Durotheca rogersii]KAI5857374.1 hypothetical protein GGS23DRAFT_600862 [Durotheca rogersii]